MSQKSIRTRLSVDDQIKLRKFLDTGAGQRILAWMRENTPTRPQPGSAEHEYVFYAGMIKGFEEYDYSLRMLGYAEQDQINEPVSETTTKE